MFNSPMSSILSSFRPNHIAEFEVWYDEYKSSLIFIVKRGLPLLLLLLKIRFLDSQEDLGLSFEQPINITSSSTLGIRQFCFKTRFMFVCVHYFYFSDHFTILALILPRHKQMKFVFIPIPRRLVPIVIIVKVKASLCFAVIIRW